MTKSDDRLTELEIEVADLRALQIEVADLRAQLASRLAPVPAEPPKPRAVVEEGVTITHPTATNHGFVMPDENQLRQLLDIACRKYPVLRKGISTGRFASQDERDFYREYEAAFRAIGSIARMPVGEVDQKHYADRTVRMVQGHLQDKSMSVGLLPVTAAIVCHNDITFQLNPNHMMSSAFGLRDDGVGIMAGDAWRHVLTTGNVRDSLPLPPPMRTWRMQGTSRMR